MTSSEIRASFLDFFREKGHTIVPSSPLLPDSPNLLFTNAGMNQFVPIFLGQVPCPYKPARAADTQKCIRAGGKHNDLEDVGFDTYHHTFFEMLGNWSFGDYFKKEAIAWAWELVVERWKFPPTRIYATVYSPGPGDPASFDQEAHDHWAKIFIAAGLDPALHIVNGNKKDNFWMMGDTGPCGPCSELHIDLTPGPRDLSLERQQEGRKLVNAGDARCIEIWNLVFIQFNANPDGTYVELPAKHVDTGMGFERVTSMIQGTKGFTDLGENVKISNYETDVFRPIFDELEKITGKKYQSTLPKSAQNLSEDEKTDVAFRVIADHIRTLSFSIADGIQPSNEGRGYVLRRILRRAVRYGRNLGLKEPFLGKLVPTLVAEMQHVFPEMEKKSALVMVMLRNEEYSFMQTLERGIELFESVILSLSKDQQPSGVFHGSPAQPASPQAARHPELVEGSVQSVFPGSEAFKLYDTYGFPLDLTELMARERGMTVDIAEFDRLMEEQKARGKAGRKVELITVASLGLSAKAELQVLRAKTNFVGYEMLLVETILAAVDNDVFAANETPFYTEMGGQVGDIGDMNHSGQKTEVLATTKTAEGRVLHKLKAPLSAKPGDRITLHVDEPRRRKIEAHHSGTHIMHWALRKVLGNTVSQKGSYVGPDRLRFDFSHGAALTPEELAEVEKLVNEKIQANVPVSWAERPYAEVKGDPGILQFFGDKYGERVRVVSIGDFSKELCGGTHVRHSGDVGYFKILHESAIAAGVRRIEAASGPALIEHIRENLPKQDEQYSSLRQRKPDLATLQPFSGEVTPRAFWKYWEDRLVSLHNAAAEVVQHEKETSKRAEAAFQKKAADEAPQLIAAARTVNDIPLVIHHVTDAAPAYLPVLADALKHHWQGVAVLAAAEQGKVSLLCGVAPAFTKKIQAGKIIQAVAPLVGGKGGGRPDLAQGGGTNPAGIPAALAKAEEIVRG
ncbi:MAG: alanine--tRNA ligase [Methylacidiphilales bacterium]|nr:alanine--tRNA ligase [Candidatus Methylacidiphilales bacterium]